MKTTRVVAIMLLALVLTGCVSMTDREKRRKKEMQAYELDTRERKIKSPTAATLLNLGPGLGNFYLAWETGQFTGTDMWIAGVTNLVMWPVSPIWSMYAANVDAKTLNTRATLDYYYHTGEGLRVIEAHESAARARGATKKEAGEEAKPKAPSG